MRGAPHKGLAWRMRRIRSRMFAATSGLPGKAAGFPGPMPGESSAVPTEDRVGLNHLETSPPTGPESVQHNPQEPVAGGGGASDAARSFGRRQVGGEARGSPPAGKHGFENWRLTRRKGRKGSSS